MSITVRFMVNLVLHNPIIIKILLLCIYLFSSFGLFPKVAFLIVSWLLYVPFYFPVKNVF